jgi:hypothetical protein
MIITLETSREDKVSDPEVKAELKAKLQKMRQLGPKEPERQAATHDEQKIDQLNDNDDNVVFLNLKM